MIIPVVEGGLVRLRKNLYGFLLILFSLLLVISGCGESGSTQEPLALDAPKVPLNALKLQQPQNCDDLKNYIVTSLVARYTTLPQNSNYCSISGGGENQAPPTDAVSANPDAGSGGNNSSRAPDDVSDTNNQEQGVNEADVVKADDNGIVYVVSGRHLVVAKGFPPREMSTLKEVDLGAHGTQLFLDKSQQRLVVLARYEPPVYIADLGDATDVAADAAIYPPINDWNIVVAIFYDVSTPENPVMIDQIRFQGYYQTGRRIDDRVHLLLRSNYYPEVLYQDAETWQLLDNYWQAVREAQCENPDAGTQEIAASPAVIAAKLAFTQRVSSLFDNTAIEDYLPTAHRQTTDNVLQPIPFLACSDIHHPEVSASLGLQVIASMDTDGQNLGATAIVNNAWQTYVSKDNLYIAETSWHWWWTAQDASAPAWQTAIYKFAISGANPQYTATGTVNGHVRNQFSFSEYNGALRVATTEADVVSHTNEDGSVNRRWERKNNVFVLSDDHNGDLKLVGAVRGFGKDETIRSSRFMGERGFVVTFRQVDPLFTFDLSDPANPILMGELTIPGFSEYMHAYDNNHIITIGRAGGEGGTGVGNGIQLQLFDVSDLQEPTLLHEYTPQATEGWSWSAAEYDHKAFTFYQPANLLAIPLQTSLATGSVFSGIAAYEVSLDTGFRELGRVDHSDLAYEYYCNSDVRLLPDYVSSCSNGSYYYWAAPRRSIVMTSGQDVYLYTVSDMGMKAAHIMDLQTVLGSVLFPPQPYPWWYYLAEPQVTDGSGGVAVF
ncbi:beta-propeller domain-containing protein [Kaarinaea lacus]